MTRNDYKRELGALGDKGPGGWKCPCCGPKPGEERRKVRRAARRKARLALKKETDDA